MAKNKELWALNKAKYAKPPSWEQIEEFLQELGINMYHFERFYGLPFNTLAQVKSGKRDIPVNYWHFIYERIKPAYGVGFIEDYSINNKINRIKHRVTSSITNKTINDNHNRLNAVK